jgi:hypothetical protein
MAELREDPDYVARERAAEVARASRHREVARIRQPLLAELNDMGYAISDLNDLKQKYAPLPDDVVRVLLTWVPRISDLTVKEQIVRSLGASARPFPGAELISTFEATESEPLRWAIANTISLAAPRGLEQWLPGALSNERYGNARQMLVIAAARMLSPSEANTLILPLLNQMPLHVATALAEIGGTRELGILEERLGTAKGIERKELQRAIRKIGKRLSKME